MGEKRVHCAARSPEEGIARWVGRKPTGPTMWRVAMDEDGNVYVVGELSDAVRFGIDMEMAAGSADAFVISCAGDGSYAR